MNLTPAESSLDQRFLYQRCPDGWNRMANNPIRRTIHQRCPCDSESALTFDACQGLSGEERAAVIALVDDVQLEVILRYEAEPRTGACRSETTIRRTRTKTGKSGAWPGLGVSQTSWSSAHALDRARRWNCNVQISCWCSISTQSEFWIGTVARHEIENEGGEGALPQIFMVWGIPNLRLFPPAVHTVCTQRVYQQHPLHKTAQDTNTRSPHHHARSPSYRMAIHLKRAVEAERLEADRDIEA